MSNRVERAISFEGIIRIEKKRVRSLVTLEVRNPEYLPFVHVPQPVGPSRNVILGLGFDQLQVTFNQQIRSLTDRVRYSESPSRSQILINDRDHRPPAAVRYRVDT